MRLQRDREDMCVFMCVCSLCGTKSDKEYADPQLWLQSSPDKSVLHNTVMYPRAGSAEAATSTKAEPRDNSGYLQIKRWSSDARRAVAEQCLCPAQHGVSYFTWIRSTHFLQNLTLFIFCRMCFSSQTCSIRALGTQRGDFWKCTNKIPTSVQNMTRVQTCARFTQHKCIF